MVACGSIIDAMTKAALMDRDAKLSAELRKLGDGWAIGYRIKNFDFDCTDKESNRQTFAWEFYPVKLVDGELLAGLAGFTYVTLRDDAETATN